MRDRLRSLSDTGEFVLVLVIGFGYFIIWSLFGFLSYLSNNTSGITYQATNTDIYFLALYELIALSIVVFILRTRGWSIMNLNVQPSWKLTGAGILLVPVCYLLGYTFFIFVTLFLFLTNTLTVGEADVMLHSVKFEYNSINPLALGLILTVNSLYEEFLVVGYVITVLQKKKSKWFAINLSVLIRVLYHLYQGPGALPHTIPMAFIFAYYYCRWQRLWPLFVAHAILNFITYIF